jgi:O-antigen/teichoic acid export membrane protein
LRTFRKLVADMDNGNHDLNRSQIVKLWRHAGHLWQEWGTRVVFNIADQGIFSGANFVLNILLARWLPTEDYGGFSVAFTIFLLLTGFATSLIQEPVAIFGSKRYQDHLPKYLKFQLKTQFGLMIILGLILSGVAMLISGPIKQALFGVSLSLPFIMVFWFLRRACYVETRPQLAAKASLFYMIILLGGGFILRGVGLLSPFSIYILMGFSSTGASIFLGGWLKIGFLNGNEWPISQKKSSVIHENWAYGKWILAASAAYWIATFAYLPLIGLFVGIEEAAALRANQNLILPLLQALSAFYLMLLPWWSRNQANMDIKGLKKILGQTILALGLVVIGYNAFLIVFGKNVLWFAYRNSYYQGFYWILPFLGFVALVNMISNVISISLSVMENSRPILIIRGSAAIIVLTIGIWSIWLWGLPGFVVSIIVSAITETIVALWVFLRFTRKMRNHNIGRSLDV